MKKTIGIFVIVLLLLTVIPTAALAVDVGGGVHYDDNDFYKLQAFLNTSDGTTNGLKIDSGYVSGDPTTWAGVVWGAGDGSAGNPYRVSHIGTGLSWYSKSLILALDVSGFTELLQLRVNANAITSINTSGAAKLEELSFNSNAVTAIDISTNTALEEISIVANQLTTLDASGLTALRILYCHGNQLTTLDVSGSTALETLGCHANLLTTLDVSGLTALEALGLGGNELTMLDVSGLSNLIQLLCFDNELSSLIFGTHPDLNSLVCSINQLGELDISGSPNLTSVLSDTNMITRITANLFGGVFNADTVGEGYINISVAAAQTTFTAEETTGSFMEWTLSTGAPPTTPLIVFGAGVSVDVTAHFLTIAASREDKTIYQDGRITLIPNYPGGAWSYDHPALVSGTTDGDELELEGVTSGIVRVTYTIPGGEAAPKSVYIDIIVSPNVEPPIDNPDTGDSSYTWIYLAALALLLSFAGVFVFVKSKKLT